MISITSKSPYAVKALAELGRSADGQPVPIGELARRRAVPVQFLEQLFAVLRRAGILRSQRGVKGGYSFARDPSQISVLELVELLDGTFGAGSDGVFAGAAAGARAVPEPTTLADVSERGARAHGPARRHPHRGRRPDHLAGHRPAGLLRRRARGPAGVAMTIATLGVLISPLVHDGPWPGAVQRMVCLALAAWLMLLCRAITPRATSGHRSGR